MSEKEIDISVIIPAYNEGKNLPTLINNIFETFNKSKFNNNFEVIVVNDGSQDKTEQIVNDILKIKKNYL